MSSNYLLGVSLVAQMVKNLPAMQETWIWSLSQEDPLKKGMPTHSCILAWKIPWPKKPGGLQSMESQKVGHDWVTNTHTTICWINEWRDGWMNKQSFCLGWESCLLRIQSQEVGLSLGTWLAGDSGVVWWDKHILNGKKVLSQDPCRPMGLGGSASTFCSNNLWSLEAEIINSWHMWRQMLGKWDKDNKVNTKRKKGIWILQGWGG